MVRVGLAEQRAAVVIEVENQGDADWGSAIDMIFATEKSANTAFVDMTLKMDDGPQAIIKMATTNQAYLAE